MCGIAGIISPHPALVQQQTLSAMAEVLKHRGPESEGFWLQQHHYLGLAHRRLAIVDLHTRAAQPLHYLHYTIVFNGEIYNYLELKNELKEKGYAFTTEADTEVIPAAFDCWGMACLHRFDGMFAFALWDENQQQLVLARDRFGEKPLYYHAQYAQRGRFERFVFASEMKALWAASAPRYLNGTMVLNYITQGLVQHPLKKTATFYNDILSLPPGHYLTIQPQQGRVQMKRWYRMGDKQAALGNSSGTHPKVISAAEATEQFSSLLQTSVQRRLRSDVAVGSCLSGGIDSSAIVALCNGLKTPHLSQQCFTAVFPGFEKDEYLQSKQVADYFKLQQHTVEVTGDDWINNFQQLMYHQEEPLQSSSVLAQFMVYRLAQQHGVTVLLDGQGADEILGGYKKYVPWHLQQLLHSNFAGFVKEKQLLQRNLFLEGWGLQHYISAFLPVKTAQLLQKRAIAQQRNTGNIQADFLQKFQDADSLQKPVIRKLEDILYYNTFNVGLQELLRYADRNSMAHSREVRLPFLYHELVEFVFSLPAAYKIHDGFTKWVLRQSMQQALPADIVWRKDKIGYEPPQKKWMQQPAAQEMIIEARKKLVQHNVLDKAVINKPVSAPGAHEKEAFDWRYLCTAALL
jgi:asparagine synthase (glutamine-hydrolysing)